MKYYSEITKKNYDTPAECMEAERAVAKARKEEQEKKEKKAAERKEQAAKVTAAREAYIEARSNYAKELEDFTKKFGNYHATYTDEDAKRMAPALFDFILDGFFNS